jgi:hypothetical protein
MKPMASAIMPRAMLDIDRSRRAIGTDDAVTAFAVSLRCLPVVLLGPLRDPDRRRRVLPPTPDEAARDKRVTKRREAKSGATSPQPAVAPDDTSANAIALFGPQTFNRAALPC